MLQYNLVFRNDTKSCYRFERRTETGDLITLYLKKADVQKAGIDPKKGIIVTIEETN